MKRLVILGAGAIGGGIGSLLALAGLPVALIARGSHGDTIRNHGLTLRTPDETHLLRLPCVATPDEIDWQDGDVAMVATKLGDAEAAYDSLLEAAGPDLPVVAAQNGLQGDAWAKARFTTVWETMLWVPAEHLIPGEVWLYGEPVPGGIDVSPAAEVLSTWLRRAGFRSTVRPRLQRWKRAKWITNLCGAAIALGHGDWVKGLIAEGHAVLEAAGLDTASKRELKAYLGDIRLATIGGQERLPGGSSAQSHARGKPMEIPYLNGPMAALGREVGVPTPLNDELLERYG